MSHGQGLPVLSLMLVWGGVVAQLLNNPATLTEMSGKARALSHPNAGREIAQMAIKLGNRL